MVTSRILNILTKQENTLNCHSNSMNWQKHMKINSYLKKTQKPKNYNIYIEKWIFKYIGFDFWVFGVISQNKDNGGFSL